MESSEELPLGQTTERVPLNLSDSETNGHVWTDEEVSLMVDVRLYLNGYFEKGRLTSVQIWKCICDNMVKDLVTCKNLTVLECLNKWEELVRQYYTYERDITSSNTKTRWKYYEQLHQIYKDKPMPAFSESRDNSLSTFIRSQEKKRKIENVSTIELKQYKLRYTALVWKQQKWREKKQMLRQQHQLLENLNNGIQDIVQMIKNA